MVEAYERTLYHNQSSTAPFQLALSELFTTLSLGFVANPQNSKLVAFDHGLSLTVQNLLSPDQVTIPAPVLERQPWSVAKLMRFQFSDEGLYLVSAYLVKSKYSSLSGEADEIMVQVHDLSYQLVGQAFVPLNIPGI